MKTLKSEVGVLMEIVQVVKKPAHTKNLFGPTEEIAGKRLRLLERNQEGDCLCLFEGMRGTNLVDVDHRDVARKIYG